MNDVSFRVQQLLPELCTFICFFLLEENYVSFFQHRFIRKPEADVIPEQQPPSRGDGLRSAGPGPESTRSSSPVPGSSWVKSSRLFFSTPRAPDTKRLQRLPEHDEVNGTLNKMKNQEMQFSAKLLGSSLGFHHGMKQRVNGRRL